MKKKVCILSNGLARGGTVTFVVNLVKGLDFSKYEVTVVLSVDSDEPIFRKCEIEDAKAKVIETCSVNKGIKSKIKHFRKLYHILKVNKFDVFQTNIDLFNGPNLFVAWLANIPIRICHSHNSMQEKELRNGRTISITIYQWVMRQLCWFFSNRRCGCSEEALDFLFKKRWRRDPKAVVVNNGIIISDFQKNTDILELRKQLGIVNKKVIMTVGRFSSQKNPMMIADTFIELCKIRTDCELVWVGVGEMQKKIKKIIKANALESRVHFLGTRTDVNELMQCSDVFLFPSVFEGLGIVIIEAQAAGLPCLVSNTIPKSVDCGGCEFLDLKLSPKMWAKKMNNIFEQNEKPKIDSEKLQKYSVEYMVSQMENLFI